MKFLFKNPWITSFIGIFRMLTVATTPSWQCVTNIVSIYLLHATAMTQ